MAGFTTYFTIKGAWRSADVQEIGSYSTELAAMQAGQRHAKEYAHNTTEGPRRLVWARLPQGLMAPAAFGRYDIRKVAITDEQTELP